MGDVNDPFYLVKEEIQLSVDKAKAVDGAHGPVTGTQRRNEPGTPTKSSPSATALFGSWRS